MSTCIQIKPATRDELYEIAAFLNDSWKAEYRGLSWCHDGWRAASRAAKQVWRKYFRLFDHALLWQTDWYCGL